MPKNGKISRPLFGLLRKAIWRSWRPWLTPEQIIKHHWGLASLHFTSLLGRGIPSWFSISWKSVKIQMVLFITLKTRENFGSFLEQVHWFWRLKMATMTWPLNCLKRVLILTICEQDSRRCIRWLGFENLILENPQAELLRQGVQDGAIARISLVT